MTCDVNPSQKWADGLPKKVPRSATECHIEFCTLTQEHFYHVLVAELCQASSWQGRPGPSESSAPVCRKGRRRQLGRGVNCAGRAEAAALRFGGRIAKSSGIGRLFWAAA